MSVRKFFNNVPQTPAPGQYPSWSAWYAAELGRTVHVRYPGYTSTNSDDYCTRHYRPNQEGACGKKSLLRFDKGGSIKSVFSVVPTLKSAIYFDDCACNIGYLRQPGIFPTGYYTYTDSYNNTSREYCVLPTWVEPAHDGAFGMICENFQAAVQVAQSYCPWSASVVPLRCN